MRRLAFAALLAAALPASAQEVPAHLAIARELVGHIKPEDNRYVLGAQQISFPGDPSASGYSMRADCSGFLLAIFERAKYSTRAQMEYLPDHRRRRTRPAAEDFVYSIEREKGFRRIRDVEAMRPGDLIAHAMLNKEDQRETSTTGHVFLVDSVPRSIPPQRPLVPGTRQYLIFVIDSNREHVGADDTRLAHPANKLEGLGRGSIRIYADDAGELVGWARTFPGTNRFFSYSPRFPSDTKLRKAAVGRPAS